MNVQYISNQKGQRTAVIVPIQEWNKIKKQLDLPANTTKEDNTAISKDELLADIKEALREVKLSKEGKIKLKSTWDLLDEL